MPTEQPKRLKTIKVRVTETEWASLRAACPKAQLAEWMREYCLGVVPQQRRTHRQPSIRPCSGRWPGSGTTSTRSPGASMPAR